MKKSIKLSLVLAVALTSLSAETMVNPLGSAFKSTDNGGTLPAIDAYKDHHETEGQRSWVAGAS